MSKLKLDGKELNITSENASDEGLKKTVDGLQVKVDGFEKGINEKITQLEKAISDLQPKE